MAASGRKHPLVIAKLTSLELSAFPKSSHWDRVASVRYTPIPATQMLEFLNY